LLRTCYKAALTAAAFFVGMNAAMAASPVGQWNVTFYEEPSLAKGATQGICYKSDGTWYSSTFSNWHGDWFQKGDRFRWYGETSSLGTAEYGQFAFAKLVTGEHAHFDRGTGGSESAGNWVASKVGAKCQPPASAAAAARGGPDPAKP
jgi:hypothetical protein